MRSVQRRRSAALARAKYRSLRALSKRTARCQRVGRGRLSHRDRLLHARHRGVSRLRSAIFRHGRRLYSDDFLEHGSPLFSYAHRETSRGGGFAPRPLARPCLYIARMGHVLLRLELDGRIGAGAESPGAGAELCLRPHGARGILYGAGPDFRRMREARAFLAPEPFIDPRAPASWPGIDDGGEVRGGRPEAPIGPRTNARLTGTRLDDGRRISCARPHGGGTALRTGVPDRSSGAAYARDVSGSAGTGRPAERSPRNPGPRRGNVGSRVHRPLGILPD